MKQEHINLLTLKEYHLIISSKTSRPYIDAEGNCYMFEIRSDAEAFTKEVKDTYFDKAQYYKQAVFCSEFYSYGIKGINVTRARAKDIITVPIEKDDVKNQFYNPEANRLLLRLKQTGYKKYLKQMKDIVLYAPVIIDPRFPKQHPKIHYSYATHDAGSKYYVLFSTLQDFESWSKTQDAHWKPLEVTFTKINQIRKNCNERIFFF